MKFCCKSFRSHVNEHFFNAVDLDKKYWDYKTPWMVLILETNMNKDWEYVWEFPTANTNYMPIYHCPFCGVKLK